MEPLSSGIATASDLFRQSIYSPLAGYEDTSDAERLVEDPAFRMLASRERRATSVALTSTLHWFETEVLAEERNYEELTRINADLVQHAATRSRSRRVILDIDSSESPVHGTQEPSAYNGHFESVCGRVRVLEPAKHDAVGYGRRVELLHERLKVGEGLRRRHSLRTEEILAIEEHVSVDERRDGRDAAVRLGHAGSRCSTNNGGHSGLTTFRNLTHSYCRASTLRRNRRHAGPGAPRLKPGRATR